MRLGTSVLVLFVAAACSAGSRLPRAPQGEVALEIGGGVKGGPLRLGVADLAALDQGKASGVSPATGRAVTCEGVDLWRLVERLELTRGADTLLARSGDGRAEAIPLAVVRQLRPVLALRADGARLEARELCWPNVEHFGIDTDPRAPRWWLGRVVRADLVAWRDVYGRALRLPPGAPAGSLSGARTFGARCIACHGMRGAGGTLGPDLSKGGPAVELERLRAVLASHPGWTGPGLVRPPEERIPELAAFLRSVAVAGEEAEDDPAEGAEPARRQ